MELTELAAYAEEKYHMIEEHKWADFPGFSVLTDPVTNKWVALLMRRWDPVRGIEVQHCDIKCGRKFLEGFRTPYTGPAFRMKGANWLGVLFNSNTEPDVVYGLLDDAVRLGRERGYTIVLDDGPNSAGAGRNSGGSGAAGKRYTDTLLPLEHLRGNYDKSRVEKQIHLRGNYDKSCVEKQIHLRGNFDKSRVEKQMQENRRRSDPRPAPPRKTEQIPARILEMMKLYDYTDGSFQSKCRNFRRQGAFMADYEDDAPWSGEFERYFTTYHDLNLKQLRGFFAWRTHVRSGDFNYITPSLAYMYLYELLNGIGTSSVRESLRKMKEFEAGYLDSGIGDGLMRVNLRRWMLELAILGDLPPADILQYIPPATALRDGHLVVLRTPQERSDEEIYAALSFLSDGKIEKSSALSKEPERSKHLLAQVWRRLSEHYMADGWDIFAACFGRSKRYPWNPLGNAVYMDREDRSEAEYRVTACRKYVYTNGRWFEEKYDDLYFDKYRIHAIMHEADRQIRRYLRTGHYLRAKEGEEWITPFVEAVIEADKSAIAEAAKPRITIDLSGLDKIRLDAQITRDSLLTEEEIRDEVPEQAAELPTVETEAAAAGTGLSAAQIELPAAGTGLSAAQIELPAAGIEAAAAENEVPVAEAEAAALAGMPPIESSEKLFNNNQQTPVRNAPDCAIMEFPSLDELHGRILRSLMRGEDVGDMIKSSHLMASVVADTINEALFDEIGDNVLECDGEEIMLLEEYREDLDAILGGDS